MPPDISGVPSSHKLELALRGSHPPGRDVGIKIRRVASSYKQSIDLKKKIQVLFQNYFSQYFQNSSQEISFSSSNLKEISYRITYIAPIA